MLDRIDLKILTILQKNARTSNAEIARQVEMAPSGVLERIRKLEERGIIEGYEVRLNSRQMDLGLLAFIFVRANEPFGSLQTAEALSQIPEVLEVHHIAGEDCYLIKVRTRDTRSLGELLRGPLAEVDTLISTRTTIVLNTTKETLQLPLTLKLAEEK